MLAFDLLINNSELFDGSEYIAVLSDRVDCGQYRDGVFISAKDEVESDFSKLLELRVFTDKAEYSAWRDNLGESKFFDRIASDDDDRYKTYFDELQYLDIDSIRTEKCREKNALLTTGGGKFYLFEKEKKSKVLVRTYLKQGEHGIEYVFDWRVVGYRDAKFSLPGKE